MLQPCRNRPKLIGLGDCWCLLGELNGIASGLSDFHTEKAHVIVKLFADGELSGFCQEFSEQPGRTQFEALAHRCQQAFLTVILFVRPFHFKEAVGKHDNQITRSNRRQARLISGVLKQTEGRTKTAVTQYGGNLSIAAT